MNQRTSIPPSIGSMAQQAPSTMTLSRSTVHSFCGHYRSGTLIPTRIRNTRPNGYTASRFVRNPFVAFPGVDAEGLITDHSNLLLAPGFACSSSAPDPFHVLVALGLPREAAHRTDRS